MTLYIITALWAGTAIGVSAVWESMYEVAEQRPYVARRVYTRAFTIFCTGVIVAVIGWEIWG